jgi:rhodanese-related sulfurtransferase
MTFKNFSALVTETLPLIQELMPWDVQALLQEKPQTLLVDIREQVEFDAAHIAGSLLVPRGILESACDWGYADTVPALAAARDQPLVLVCRSGNRTALAALTLQQMGFTAVYSMKTGVRGWNDYELPLLDAKQQAVDIDLADALLNPPLRPEQMPPKKAAG